MSLKPRFSYNVNEENKKLLTKKAIELTSQTGIIVTWSNVLSYLIENHTSNISIEEFLENKNQ